MKKRPGSRAAKKISIHSVALFANPQKPKALSEVSRIKAWFRRRNIKVLSSKQISKSDALVVLGGDGTILSVAPQAARAGVPVLGVNVGRLGFLTVVQLRELYRALGQWLDGKWTISERTLLEVTSPGVKTPLIALNDAVIRLKSSNRVTTVNAFINNERLAQFTGDGVIAATTTGSTAYSLSAQGPVVHPDVEALILTPICAHSFSQRPLVFPAHHVLDLQLSESKDQKDIQLCLDGQRTYPLKCGDKIRVRRSGFKLKLIHNPRVSYFSVLREKLHWGGR